MKPLIRGVKELVSYCENASDVRFIHGRTPEELDDWKEQYEALLQAFDDANYLFYLLVSRMSRDEAEMREAAEAVTDARTAMRTHVQEL